MRERDEITAQIEAEIRRITATLPTVRWYVFGSFLASDAVPSDIDLLAVHPSDVDSQLIRKEAAGLCAHLPIHLLIMNHDEQQQLDFVASQHCERILPA